MALRPHVAQELLTKVTKALGITALDQWYYVSQHVASELIGASALNQFGGSVASFLKYAYPHHSFDEEKLNSRVNLEKDQKFVEVIIRQLFPHSEIHTKARKAVGIINPETGAYLEIDFWIPSLKLGIEYQDKHHYAYQWYANNTLEEYQKRDDIKKATMASLGYTLITVGYWWDKTIDSLAATIRNVRPDLLQDFERNAAKPIPLEPPSDITSSPVIPGVAGIMNPFIPSGNFNPTNWFAGEKHDGIRGVYNPKLNKIFSRSGNELSVIASLLNDIPKMLVEGEITAGRGNYTRTASVSYHTQHDKVNWPMFRYIIFDIPDTELGNYSKRYSAIISALMAHPFIFSQSAFRVLLANKAHLKMLVGTIISDSGEGVIAQQDSPYEYGRAKGLAKIKVRRDADAQVLAINKFSCDCKLVSGAAADIVFSDDFDPSNLKIGDIISYYHTGYTQNGLPMRAEIYKVRYDITWEQLLNDKDQPVAKPRSVTEAIGSSSLIPPNIMRNKMGHWNKLENVRAFFDGFARTAGFDPLVPENWYTVKVSALQNAGGSSLLKAYGSNRKKALLSAYPDLKLKADFGTYNQPPGKNKWGHWNKPLNSREFFEQFAETAGFDPLVAENWYLVRAGELKDAGGGGLLKAFGNDIKKALSSAYPDLKFESTKFRTRETPEARNELGHWNKPENVQEFFDEFARTAGFEPLVPENWYPVRVSALRNSGGAGLLNAYDYDLKNALSCAYPELSFDKEKFETHAIRGQWTKPENVRAFFDQFARTSGFDPLVAENWYPVRLSLLRNTGGGGLLNAYDYNLKNALSCAYPELQFDMEKFETHAIRGHWSKPANVREFFDNFAETAGFDPLVVGNWNSVRVGALRDAGGGGLLSAHGNIISALSCAYPELKFGTDNFETEGTRGRWNNAANVRVFFDEYARTAGFDPLVPENWKAVRHSTLQQAGGSGLLQAYGYNIKKALSSAYPNLKFEEIMT